MHYLSFKNYPIAFFRQFRATLPAIALLLMSVQFAAGQAVTCPPNIDFSFGNLNNWTCSRGSSSTGITTAVYTGSSITGPVTNYHTITSGTGTDPYGGFSEVAPGGGLFSVRVGNSVTGGEAERIQYTVRVPAGFNNYSFNFRYAVVFEDPGHAAPEQPAFIIEAYDSATLAPIPCATLTYVAGAGLPGFFSSPSNSGVQCLGWTNGTLNLSGTGGRTIIVQATSYDCTLSGHFGYGYFDVISCGQFAATIAFCDLSKNLVTLSAPAGYKDYKWFVGPTIAGTSPISSARTFNLPPPSACTFYYCVLTPFNGNGCPDTIRTRNICNFQIAVTPDTVCNTLGKPIQLAVSETGGLPNKTYYWIPDPTLGSFSPKKDSAIASPIGSGVYVVSVSDSVGCVRNDTVVIENPAFRLNLGPDITTCLGTPVTLNPTLTPASPGYIYKWSPSANLSDSTVLKPVFTPTAIGTLTYALRVDSSACATSDTIKIRTLPNTFSTVDTAVCENEEFTPRLIGTDPAFTYTWTPTIGVTPPTGVTPRIKIDTSRSYIVTARYPTCPDIVRSVNFRVEPFPRIDLGLDTFEKCFYQPLYLTAHVGPDWFTQFSYQWQANDFIDNLTTPIIAFTGKSDTTLYLTVRTPLGCFERDSVRVRVYSGDFGTVTPSDTAVCPRNPVTMSAGGGTSYIWVPALGLSSDTGSTVVATPAASTNYTLYVTDRNNCIDTIPVSLQVYSEALVALPDSAILYPGQSYQLDPGGNALYFSWFPTVGLSNPGIANPLATPSVNTRYYVTGTTEAGCIATDSIYVYVNEESAIGMPNAFSPGSSPNPEFKISRLGDASLKSFRVYNRWGTKVFETSDINKGWNGQFNGQPQPMGVYIYTVEAVNNKNRPFVKQGNVTLIR